MAIVYYILEGELKSEHFYFLSDDKHHDNDFVQVSLNKLVAQLEKDGLKFNVHRFFTDGGPGPGLRL